MSDPSQAGMIPEAAQRRLADLEQRAQSGRITALTDVSVDELILIEAAGFLPLGMVMGSSIFHIGFQQGNWGNMELEVLTGALYQARELAMNRMRAEAAALQADGIVSVELSISYPRYTEHHVEYTSIGTAVKAKDGSDWKAPDGGPFTSHLSGQSLWKLVCAGYAPLGMTLGNCVYHVAYQGIRQQLKQRFANIENPTFTQALYEARELALGRMQAEAEQLGADLVVETNVDWSTHTWEYHVMEYFALGTAVRRTEGGTALTPSLMVSVDSVM